MGKLTTHVLDTARGCPAAGMNITLYRLGKSEDERCEILDVTTNSDGRCEQPLLAGRAFAAGRYELVFQAGEYFRSSGIDLPQTPFLDDIVIRFGISDPGSHYHVPLLLSPFGYSTYRGS